jgi:exopolyphosphatase/guanosine-5'-triphosphate,3'-diphosphate pyrophosphatase
MKIAAIDIGSNSIKLLVAELGPHGTLIPLRREKAVVRLGHETLLKGHLSSEAIVRAIRTIGVFKTASLSSGAEHIIAIATASVREADNAAPFIKEVESRTGIRIEVLSGVEEARLIGVAASHGAHAGRRTLLNIDIGGGSTELSLMKNGTAISLQSMRIGAVRLNEQFLTSDPPKAREIEAMRREIDGALEHPIREMKGAGSLQRGAKWDIVTGTSGTIIAIGAALRSGSLAGDSDSSAKGVAYPDSETDQRALPSLPITRPALSKFNRHLASLTTSERKKIPGISEQRAEIIIAGGQILEQTLHALKIGRLTACQWGLREGVILDRLSEFEARYTVRARETSSAMRSDSRLAGAETLGLRFGYEEAHGKHVSILARKLFDQLQSLHKLTEHDRTLLAAAALLHDIGYAISADSHHKHSLYLILNSELTGFTDLERLIIANIARYHRKALPKIQHPDFNRLSADDQGRVWKLGGILRIADAMDRSHQSRVKNFKCIVRRDRVLLELLSARRCDHEVWAIQNKKDMFEAAFERVLEVVKD